MYVSYLTDLVPSALTGHITSVTSPATRFPRIPVRIPLRILWCHSVNCIQMRNLILSAYPRNMRLRTPSLQTSRWTCLRTLHTRPGYSQTLQTWFSPLSLRRQGLNEQMFYTECQEISMFHFAKFPTSFKLLKIHTTKISWYMVCHQK